MGKFEFFSNSTFISSNVFVLPMILFTASKNPDEQKHFGMEFAWLI
jgi:hypothetical protein